MKVGFKSGSGFRNDAIQRLENLGVPLMNIYNQRHWKARELSGCF